MRYEELQQILGERFPQLLPSISHYFDTYGYDYFAPHILYHAVLNPYVEELLQKENDNKLLKEVFTFYEELAKSGDEEVKNLLQVTLLEALWEEKKLLSKACVYMLPETKKINDAIRAYSSLPVE